MADGKRRSAWRTTLAAALVGACVWLVGVWPPPTWWRDHWPRQTAMMREEAADCRMVGSSDRVCPSDHPTIRPTVLRDLSPLLQRMVIIGEDSRFRTHHGVDPAEMADALGLERGAGIGATLAAAWRRRDRLRGASTITQQLAKNLYLSPSRNPFRKLKEIATALRLESALSKDRILELYLDTAEWGDGIWGADQASRTYFGVPAATLDVTQAAELAAVLPHPRTSNPLFQPGRTLARRDLILARYWGRDVALPPDLGEVDTLVLPAMAPLPAPPVLDSLRGDSTRGDTTPPPDTLRRDTTLVH